MKNTTSRYLRPLIPLLLAIPALAPAATITWGTPSNITGDSDISNAGVQVFAANIGNGGTTAANSSFGPAVETTINGVTFAGLSLNTLTPSSSPPVSTIAQFSPVSANNASTGLTLQGTNRSTFGGGSAFNALSLEYQALLSMGAYSNVDTALTFSSLVTGEIYQFQWWTSDSRSLATAAARSNVQASAGNSVSLDYNTSAFGSNGIGQYAIGTFTADGPTQEITFSAGSGGVLINGFQLRNIPEPTSAVLAGLALLGTMGRRRRRN